MVEKKVKFTSFREFCCKSDVINIAAQDKKLWIRLPEVLLDAIDMNLGNILSTQSTTKCYILQGCRGVGKSSILCMLNELLLQYGLDVKSTIVVNIPDISRKIPLTNKSRLENYQKYLPDKTEVNPYSLIHDADDSIARFVLIDQFHKKPHDDYHEYNMLPFDNNSWNKNTIYIIAGSGSWEMNYGDDNLVCRGFNEFDKIAKYFKTVEINKLKAADVKTCTKVLGKRYTPQQLTWFNLYCDGRFFFINQMMDVLMNRGDSFEVGYYYKQVFNFIRTKFTELESKIKADVWNALIQTIYYNGFISPSLRVYDIFKNVLELLDQDNSIILPFEEALVDYFRKASIDQVTAYASSLSTYIFEATFMPIYLNDIAKSERSLQLQYGKNTDRFTELNFTSCVQLLKSSPEFLAISLKDPTGPFTARKDTFYLMPPRFPVIDGFLVVEQTCYAVQISNSPYENHSTKKEDLRNTSNSKEFSFLNKERVEKCINRVTGIPMTRIQYVYISPVFNMKCPEGMYQMPSGWIEEACENQLLKPFQEYLFNK